MLGDPDVQTFQNLFWAFDEDGSRLGASEMGVPPFHPWIHWFLGQTSASFAAKGHGGLLSQRHLRRPSLSRMMDPTDR